MSDPVKTPEKTPAKLVHEPEHKTAQEKHAEGKAGRLEQAAKIHKDIEQYLKDYDYKESEIPHSSPYWDLVNQYRGLKNS